jgi:hypothetical protein
MKAFRNSCTRKVIIDKMIPAGYYLCCLLVSAKQWNLRISSIERGIVSKSIQFSKPDKTS